MKAVEWSCQNSEEASSRRPSTGDRHTGEWREQEDTCGLERQGTSVVPVLQHGHLSHAAAMWVTSPVLSWTYWGLPTPVSSPRDGALLPTTTCPSSFRRSPGLLGRDQCFSVITHYKLLSRPLEPHAQRRPPRTRPPSNVTAVLALHEDTFIRVFSQCEHTWLCLYLRSLLTLWESLVSSWWPRGLLLPPEVALRVALYLAVRL